MSDPFEETTSAGQLGPSQSEQPSNTTRLEGTCQNFFPWATPAVVLRILSGFEDAFKEPTYLKPHSVDALNQVITKAVYQQESAVQEYLDPVWEVIGSLKSIQERDATVQNAVDALKLKTHQITDSMSREAILYIKSLDADQHLAATEYWQQATQRHSSFLAKSMSIAKKRFDKALDAAKEIWRQREEARGEIEEEIDVLLECLYEESN